MATDGPTPSPCDREIFEKGESVAILEGSSNAVEKWVKKIAKTAKARVDWHYSGGIANVLHLGDEESRTRVMTAIKQLKSELEGTLLKKYEPGATGFYRKDVTEAPKGAMASFNVDGENVFVVDESS